MRRRSSGPTLSTTSFASIDSTTPSIVLPPASGSTTLRASGAGSPHAGVAAAAGRTRARARNRGRRVMGGSGGRSSYERPRREPASAPIPASTRDRGRGRARLAGENTPRPFLDLVPRTSLLEAPPRGTRYADEERSPVLLPLPALPRRRLA